MSTVSLSDLELEIEAAWEARDSVSPATQGPVRTAIEETLALLDSGKVRVAEKVDGEWIVRQWAKKAVLLSFRLNPNAVMRAGAMGGAVGPWWDKVANKFDGWEAPQFEEAGFRAVPGAIVRRGAYVAKNVILMPSFVNIGGYVDEGTMVDTWVTVGSCAQIGKRVHLSVGQGAVLSMGVYLSATTKIVDRKTGQVHIGKVPPYSVVVPGSLPDPHGVGPSLYCAVIVKTVDAQTRSKTSINDLLRD